VPGMSGMDPIKRSAPVACIGKAVIAFVVYIRER
jgi:hypothetical protein